ncbi:hypothetical protein C2E21_6962 [Chlorella sorokiniana]|uniref:Uncharacterized protein n=1 Tax=Chlorella sorokiniana TaxID=3076 RepID=A0A2P6TIN5_CHLSO|nr:hypothetical protein C2E21_6962 [Chlorella sorokiniana]|eukprot:PRW39105.1 hypothetical protein C2E21_6962 [Chlorella sorokiniana]
MTSLVAREPAGERELAAARGPAALRPCGPHEAAQQHHPQQQQPRDGERQASPPPLPPDDRPQLAADALAAQFKAQLEALTAISLGDVAPDSTVLAACGGRVPAAAVAGLAEAARTHQQRAANGAAGEQQEAGAADSSTDPPEGEELQHAIRAKLRRLAPQQQRLREEVLQERELLAQASEFELLDWRLLRRPLPGANPRAFEPPLQPVALLLQQQAVRAARGAAAEVFSTIFGATTTSNNTSWIRQKLKGALGLGGKKPRASGNAGGRKRSAGPSEGSGGGRGKQARAASPDSLPTGSHWAGFGAAPCRSPRMGRSPSSDWDRFSLGEWGSEDQTADSLAAVAGAATLLAAAAEVESREAAAAAAAGTGTVGTGAGGSALGGPAQHGATHNSTQPGQPAPESPGGSATGSSLSPPPADASQQVQAFLQGFLRAAQATGASAPAVPGVPIGGAPPAATVAAGRVADPAQGPALPSFLTPQQPAGSAGGQPTAVYRLLAALAASSSGHPL